MACCSTYLVPSTRLPSPTRWLSLTPSNRLSRLHFRRHRPSTRRAWDDPIAPLLGPPSRQIEEKFACRRETTWQRFLSAGIPPTSTSFRTSGPTSPPSPKRRTLQHRSH